MTNLRFKLAQSFKFVKYYFNQKLLSSFSFNQQNEKITTKANVVEVTKTFFSSLPLVAFRPHLNKSFTQRNMISCFSFMPLKFSIFHRLTLPETFIIFIKNHQRQISSLASSFRSFNSPSDNLKIKQFLFCVTSYFRR